MGEGHDRREDAHAGSPELALDGLFIEMRAGTFMILWPQDAHMPGMAIDASSPVKKAVVKVRL